jgi:hypothetical protein
MIALAWHCRHDEEESVAGLSCPLQQISPHDPRSPLPLVFASSRRPRQRLIAQLPLICLLKTEWPFSPGKPNELVAQIHPRMPVCGLFFALPASGANVLKVASFSTVVGNIPHTPRVKLLLREQTFFELAAGVWHYLDKVQQATGGKAGSLSGCVSMVTAEKSPVRKQHICRNALRSTGISPSPCAE